MAYNKVEANGETLIDLTSDTVTADTLVSGRTAHLASGEKVTGTFEPVTGVKGNAESAYRTGDVNLTPANLGLGNVNNTSDLDKPISTATQTALNAQQAQIDDNSEVSEVTDTNPYIYKSSEHDAVYDELVGGSVVWNQLVANSGSSLSVTITSGHKYVMKKSGTLSVGASSGSAITGLTGGTDWITDLTLMFGSTIADYVYTLAGSGIEWLKSYGFFTEDYYAYNAGELMSVNTSGKKVVGKNLVKLQDKTITANAYIFDIRGLKLPAGIYTFSFDSTFTGIVNFAAAGSNADYTNRGFSNKKLTFNATGIITSIRFYGGAGTYSNMQLELNSTATDYEPYTELTYPIQSTDLRGLYKLNGNKLYTDGDIYSADGTVTRKYGIVDLGTLEWTYNSTDKLFYSSTVSNGIIPINPAPNSAICPKYTIYTGNDYSSEFLLMDKVFCYSWRTFSTTSRIVIKDSSYTDAATFKTAMSGIYLIYELATPTTAIFAPFTSPQIVYRNGTEEYLDIRDVPIPVGGNRKYVDIPDWMVNEYFDDLRNSVYELTQDLDDISEELDCLTIQAALVNNEVVIQNTSDFTNELYSKYFSLTKPKFAILKLQITSNTYYYKALINSSSVSHGNIMEASFITVNGGYMGIYNFRWNFSSTVGTPTVSYTSLNLGS